MADNIAISVKNVSKEFKLPHEKRSSIKSVFINIFRRQTYERQKVLDNISFEIKKGEFFGIVGRNGSGKSTLLKVIAGIYSPNSGHLEVNGKLTPFIELGVGFNPDLTGRENVFLNGALLGFNRKEMESMYDEIVTFAELERFMDQKLKNYSSGMQVRLAFSIAIRANSDILVLDEVLAVGDANFQRKCFEYFRQLKADKKTVILVSHDMEAVKKFSDRALMLESGRVLVIGEPDEVSDEYTISNIEKERQLKGLEPNVVAPGIIKNVKILNKDDKQIRDIASNEPLKIAVEYEAEDTIEVLNFSIGLHSDANGYAFGYSTQMDRYNLRDNKGTLLLTFKNLPLLKGTYHMNVVCFGQDETVPLDFRPRILTLDIRTTGMASAYRGLLNIDHSWKQHNI